MRWSFRLLSKTFRARLIIVRLPIILRTTGARWWRCFPCGLFRIEFAAPLRRPDGAPYIYFWFAWCVRAFVGRFGKGSRADCFRSGGVLRSASIPAYERAGDEAQ